MQGIYISGIRQHNDLQRSFGTGYNAADVFVISYGKKDGNYLSADIHEKQDFYHVTLADGTYHHECHLLPAICGQPHGKVFLFCQNSFKGDKMLTSKTIAIALFVLMYVLMVLLPKKRAVVALSTAAIYVILTLIGVGGDPILPITQVPSAIDWNILMMLVGTMVIVDYFIESKMPNVIAEWLLRLAPNVLWVTILMSLFSDSQEKVDEKDGHTTVFPIPSDALKGNLNFKQNPGY